jgi:hypothetical protein
LVKEITMATEVITDSNIALIANYIRKYFLKDGYTYSWNVSPNCWSKLDTNFDHQSFSDAKKVNKALKYHLSDQWTNSTNSQKIKLATWVVKDWGGIKGNKSSTIEKYVKLVDQSDPETPIKGVASYSKILAIKNPIKYAIYDARVAASLNAIQIICDVNSSDSQKLFFPYLPGRNTKIQGTKTQQGFVKIANKKRLMELGFQPVKRDYAYGLYLELLSQLTNKIDDVDIVDIEMLLFSEVINFCSEAENRL